MSVSISRSVLFISMTEHPPAAGRKLSSVLWRASGDCYHLSGNGSSGSAGEAPFSLPRAAAGGHSGSPSLHGSKRHKIQSLFLFFLSLLLSVQVHPGQVYLRHSSALESVCCSLLGVKLEIICGHLSCWLSPPAG